MAELNHTITAFPSSGEFDLYYFKSRVAGSVKTECPKPNNMKKLTFLIVLTHVATIVVRHGGG